MRAARALVPESDMEVQILSGKRSPAWSVL